MESPPQSPSLAASPPTSTRGDAAPGGFLTPRSKIKAMMARIDNSDDDDDLQIPISSAQKSSPLPETQKKPALDDMSSDEDDHIHIPRGRLAGRLRAAQPSNGYENSDDSRPKEAESAYDRLKRELDAKKQCEQAEINKSADQGTPVEEAELQEPIGLRRVLFTKTIPRSSQKPSTEFASVSSQSHDDVSATASPQRSRGRGASNSEQSDSEAERSTGDKERLMALVQKKRAERKAREAQEEAKRARTREINQERLQRSDEILAEIAAADGEDPVADLAMSSQVKPTRKASKKAIEAMNRETQRMSRNMQLAHAATTRKKISKDALFAKFNFRQSVESKDAVKKTDSSLPGTSQPGSEVEIEHPTPPTSPASSTRSPAKNMTRFQEDFGNDSLPVYARDDSHLDPTRLDEELPSVEELLTAPASAQPPHNEELLAGSATKLSSNKMSTKAKGKQRADPLLPLDAYDETNQLRLECRSIRSFRVKVPESRQVQSLDSDSDLEIAPVKPMAAKFDRLLAAAPQKRNESNNKIKFRALAHLTSPNRRDSRGSKPSIPAARLSMDLQRRAREQIVRERHERLEVLKAQGVIIQTSEEREQDQLQIEDLLEKARREVEELTKKEKAERKKEGKDDDGAEGLDLSDDESYAGSGSDDGADDAEDDEMVDSEEEEDHLDTIERSAEEASEDEDEDAELTDSEEKEEQALDAQSKEFDPFNETGNEREGQQLDDPEVDSDAEDRPVVLASRRNRVKLVLDDDDEDDELGSKITPKESSQADEESTSSPIVNPFANAGAVNPFGAAPMGLTQAFAATMESDADEDDLTQDSSAFVAPMPEPDLPIVDQGIVSRQQGMNESFLEMPPPMVPATQHSTQQTQMTQDFEMPDPTQDGGLMSTSPIAQRFASIPPSTVATLLVDNPQAAEVVNPTLKRKGRLIRRALIDRLSDDDEDINPEAAATLPAAELPVTAADAFTAMKRAEKHRQRLEEFNKKKSAAKAIVDEQAEESEDEYAGIGGASDDESGGEMDEETKKMLDDETQLDLNESQLAAFHANKERMSDEKAIEKLYKDINSGMLRRKRGTGGFDDLSDSDDEAERRQRMRRAENARMRKALLADENVGKIAENPKKAAFLKAIEDRDDDDSFGYGFVEEPETLPDIVREDSMQEVPNSQPEQLPETSDESNATNKRKRPLQEADPNARLPPSLRRTKPGQDGYRKPATIAEIRESVSFLVEDSRGTEILVPATQTGEDSDGDASHEAAESRFAARRRANPVVDRISIKRAESANSNGSGAGRVAFLAKGRDEQGFRVPSLLKKATSLSSTGEVTYATERTAGRKEGEVKKGGTKKSSVAYFARESERQAAVVRVEKRRNAERKKTAEVRRGVLRGLGGGQFE